LPQTARAHRPEQTEGKVLFVGGDEKRRKREANEKMTNIGQDREKKSKICYAKAVGTLTGRRSNRKNENGLGGPRIIHYRGGGIEQKGRAGLREKIKSPK